MFPVAPRKDFLLLFCRNPDPVILDNDDQPGSSLFAADDDLRHPFPMPDSVVEEVEKDPFQHRIGKDLAAPAGIRNYNNAAACLINNVTDPEPCRGLNTQFLVGLRELDLATYRLCSAVD